MNVKRLLFWAALFGGLLTYVLLCEQVEPPRQAALPAEEYARVFAVEPDDITGLLIAGAGKTVRISKRGGDAAVLEPAGATVSQELIESLLSALCDAVVIDEVEAGDSSDEYGLDQPDYTLQISTRGSAEPQTLLLGGNAPSNINMYGRLPQQGKTVLLGTYLRFSVRTFLDNVK